MPWLQSRYIIIVVNASRLRTSNKRKPRESTVHACTNVCGLEHVSVSSVGERECTHLPTFGGVKLRPRNKYRSP